MLENRIINIWFQRRKERETELACLHDKSPRNLDKVEWQRVNELQEQKQIWCVSCDKLDVSKWRETNWRLFLAKNYESISQLRNIWAEFESDVVREPTCQVWFRNFRSGDFDLNNKVLFVWTSVFDNDISSKSLPPHQTFQTVEEIKTQKNLTCFLICFHFNFLLLKNV